MATLGIVVGWKNLRRSLYVFLRRCKFRSSLASNYSFLLIYTSFLFHRPRVQSIHDEQGIVVFRTEWEYELFFPSSWIVVISADGILYNGNVLDAKILGYHCTKILSDHLSEGLWEGLFLIICCIFISVLFISICSKITVEFSIHTQQCIELVIQ